MALPSSVQTMVVNLALSKSGPYLQKVISLAAAAGAAYLAKKIPGIDQYINTPVLIGIIWTLIDSVLNAVPAGIIKQYGVQIQTVLNSAGANIKVDGLSLANTTTAIENLANPNTVGATTVPNSNATTVG